ncbi:MAG: histidinol dehydrogenase [Proteobacteria bacterium]|nr:histidinol dehydrogenase [Pseudomonadota bacterium]
MGILITGKKKIENFLERMDKRLSLNSEEEVVVREIIDNVRKEGDRAILKYTEKFDNCRISKNDFFLPDEEWERGIKGLDRRIKEVIDRVSDRLFEFYEKTKQNSFFYFDEFENLIGTRVIPLERVLVYAPGGKAVYPSSVLMGAIPAKVAGVKEIILTTPDKGNGIAPSVLYSAKKAGISKICRIGGAQAIAGFSFGTETLPKVDKIVGPGNIYVALAKKELFGYVDIDMVAGPSEVLIIFDESANLDYVAIDLLSQLEHDEKAIAIALTDKKELAERLDRIVEKTARKSDRWNIIKNSLKNSAIMSFKNLKECAQMANRISPEHLEIVIKEPFSLLPLITKAGAVFLGSNTPEAVGDYIAGPNHILPTGGTARFFSPFGVESFLKRMSIISFTEKGINALGSFVVDFANEEGLFAHSNSVSLRLKNSKDKKRSSK